MTSDAGAAQDTQDRFAFGANWARFLRLLSEERIALAEVSLREYLGMQDLRGRRFLDIGSGSGLFSLAARRLGARVHSFDYDAQSVACTAELKRRYFDGDPDWTVERGSVLDEAYVHGLGSHDIVYSWGVLHHTGEMWRALEIAARPLAPSGKLFVSIYNLQTPVRHQLLVAMKRSYVHGGPVYRGLLLGAYFCHVSANEVLAAILNRRSPLARIREYADSSRGMSWWYDIVDWVGGYPYEAAKPEAIIDLYQGRGLRLEKLYTSEGHGCNQFVFSRPAVGTA
jgi:2-polyprenyl-6-hydroxyphenyl methylase/3-demethylubiquinone-9 3-methyltransferase